METFVIEKDITVFLVPASSFPEGIAAAHEKLHALIPFSENRRYFGLSRPNRTGMIEYFAAAEELSPGEGKSLNCTNFILKKGAYACIHLKDYNKDPQQISKAFEKLLQHPELDPQGYCLEWYTNEKEMKCLVGLSSKK